MTKIHVGTTLFDVNDCIEVVQKDSLFKKHHFAMFRLRHRQCVTHQEHYGFRPIYSRSRLMLRTLTGTSYHLRHCHPCCYSMLAREGFLLSTVVPEGDPDSLGSTGGNSTAGKPTTTASSAIAARDPLECELAPESVTSTSGK